MDWWEFVEELECELEDQDPFAGAVASLSDDEDPFAAVLVL